MLQGFGCCPRRGPAPTLKRKRFNAFATHTSLGVQCASLLKRKRFNSDGSHRRLRFTVTALSDPAEHMVQLTSLNLYAGGARLDYTGVSASNPLGRGPLGSGPQRVIDADLRSKWVDWDCQPLLLDFPEAVRVEELSFTTADDRVGCDPRRFRLEGFNEDTESWDLLVDRTAADFPSFPARCIETPKLRTMSTRINRPRLVQRSNAFVGTCVVCLEGCSASMILVPCGHQALCDQCALRFAAGAACPVCRAQVQSVHKVYVASPEDLALLEPQHLQEAASRLSKEAEEARSEAAKANAEKQAMEKQRDRLQRRLTNLNDLMVLAGRERSDGSAAPPTSASRGPGRGGTAGRGASVGSAPPPT